MPLLESKQPQDSYCRSSALLLVNHVMNEMRPLTYEFEGQFVTKNWISENHFSPPKKVLQVDDSFSADRYVTLSSQGVSFVWVGDYHNAKQLLQAVQRRIKKKSSPSEDLKDPKSLSQVFYRHRQHQAHKAQILSRLLICVEADLSIRLPRAPDLNQAIRQVVSESKLSTDFLISLRELQGIVGAYEWQKKGVSIAALGNQKIHAHYGVFSPVR